MAETIDVRVSVAILLLIAFFSAIQSDQDSNKATQLIWVERGLKSNRFFIEAIDATISNYGDEIEKSVYKRCIQHQIETNILQMQFELGSSYDEMKRTQDLLNKLYNYLVLSEYRKVKSELSQLGKPVAQNQNAEAKAHLSLGFQELAKASQKILISRNTREYLYKNRIELLYQALKHIKQARKYVLLLSLRYESLYEPSLSDSSFSALESQIQGSMGPRSDEFLRMLYDNEFHLFRTKSKFKEFWDEPDLGSLEKPLDGWDSAYLRKRRSIQGAE